MANSLSSEAEQRRQTRSASSLNVRPISSQAVFIAQASGGSAAHVGAVPVDNQAFNDAVQKFESALTSLPTIGVVKL